MIYSVETCSIGVTFSRSSRFSRETLVKSIIIPSSFYTFSFESFHPQNRAIKRGLGEMRSRFPGCFIGLQPK